LATVRQNFMVRSMWWREAAHLIVNRKQKESRKGLGLKCTFLARRQWLTPIVLAIREAEIRRITVRSQPWQIGCKTLS
jgi:hypothetical protein